MTHCFQVIQTEKFQKILNWWLSLMFKIANIGMIYQELDFIWCSRSDFIMLTYVIPVHLALLVPSLMFHLSARIRADPYWRSKFATWGKISIFFVVANILLILITYGKPMYRIHVYVFFFFTFSNSCLNGALFLSIFFSEKNQMLNAKVEHIHDEQIHPELVAIPHQLADTKTEIV